jgi:EAL domain-containing protein (putative c-di-GMP-specific phosphodiesterase class I)
MNEGTFGLDVDLAGPVVDALESQGVSISIDVVGIGHPVLSHLPSIKVSEVKIEGTILADLPINEHDRAIVRSVIDIGHSLGCQVTAQGVELQEVADWLVEAGCDQAQGYLWLRPCSWAEVAQVFGGTTAMSVVGSTH